jgi:flagellar assembly factor FliW
MSITSTSNIIKFSSSRFGDLEVSAESVIDFEHGLIGFGRFKKFVMLDYKEPFSWLHSIEEPSLAFVVIDGFSFGATYDTAIAFSEPTCDFYEEDEYAILLIVTFRPVREESSVNTKAPLFVNVRNRKGVQAIYDSQSYSTRWPLWSKQQDENTAPKE